MGMVSSCPWLILVHGWVKKEGLFGTVSPGLQQAACLPGELRIVGCLLVEGVVPVARQLVADALFLDLVGNSLCDFQHPMSLNGSPCQLRGKLLGPKSYIPGKDRSCLELPLRLPSTTMKMNSAL
jgi:hypothetical protein